MERLKSQTESGSLWGGIFLACCCLTVLAVGAVGAFYLIMPTSTTSTVSESNTVSTGVPKLEALITASDLELLSETIGIVGWTLTSPFTS